VNAIIFGAPGSGKGTCSAGLKENLGVNVVSMSDTLRLAANQETSLSQTIRSCMQAGSLVPDEIVLKFLKKRLSEIPEENGFILDGFPRNLTQAKKLEKISQIDLVLEVEVPDWIIIERLSSRRICKTCGAIYNLQFLKPMVEDVCDEDGGLLYQRPDDNPTVINRRLELYERETIPLLRYYQTRKVPFITYTCKTLATPAERAVEYFVNYIRKLNLADF